MGDAIKRRMGVLSLTHEEVVGRAGVGISTLYRATRGFSIQAEPARAISEALEWPPETLHRLMAGEDPEFWIYLTPEEAEDQSVAVREALAYVRVEVKALRERVEALETELGALRQPTG